MTPVYYGAAPSHSVVAPTEFVIDVGYCVSAPKQLVAAPGPSGATPVRKGQGLAVSYQEEVWYTSRWQQAIAPGKPKR